MEFLSTSPDQERFLADVSAELELSNG